jgi:hypothetical protein
MLLETLPAADHSTRHALAFRMVAVLRSEDDQNLQRTHLAPARGLNEPVAVCRIAARRSYG